MPRIRSIHPGQWTGDRFMELSPFARLLAIALRNFADDHGVFEWKPKTIKAQCLPGDAIDIHGLLQELLDKDVVRKVTDSGKELGYIRGFLKWQRLQRPGYVHPFQETMRSYLMSGEDDSGNGLDQNDGNGNDVPGQVHERSRKKPSNSHTNSRNDPGNSKQMYEVGGRRDEVGGKQKPLASQPSQPRARERDPSPPADSKPPTPNRQTQAAPLADDAAAEGLRKAKERLATPQKTANSELVSAVSQPSSQLEPHQRLRMALSQILGPEVVSRWINFAAEMATMLNAGFDIDLDIIPCIQDRKAVQGDKFQPRSLAYCINPVRDWHEKRTGSIVRFKPETPQSAQASIPKELRPVQTKLPKYDKITWTDLARQWKERGYWEHWEDGHPPDHPDSFVPLEVCEALGIQRREKTAAEKAMVGTFIQGTH